MTETMRLVLGTVIGLSSLEIAGYTLLVWLLSPRSLFNSLERLSLAFGLGCLGLTWWMLLLSLIQVPFSVGKIAGPWLVLAVPAVYCAWRRGWVQDDCRRLYALGKNILTLGRRANFSRFEQVGLLLLIGVLAFGFLRATLYPLWEWDALSTWGLKAKAFYLGQKIELTRFEAHNYYPNLVPLLIAYLYYWFGGVSDYMVRAVFPCWGSAIFLLFYSLLRRLEVRRSMALGATAFLALNGATLVTHLFLAYADLALTYYHLAVAGLLYLWLQDQLPAGGLGLIICMSGGLSWCKYEGWPLMLIILLAAGLTLLWLRPPQWPRKMFSLALMGLGGWLFTLPWNWFIVRHGMTAGVDHLGGFYPQQLFQGTWQLIKALIWIPYFGLLWPTICASFVLSGWGIGRTPTLFLALLSAGNLAAIALGYALAPTSPTEFPLYVRATIDRLLLHFTPACGLIFAAALKNKDGTSSPQ